MICTFLVILTFLQTDKTDTAVYESAMSIVEQMKQANEKIADMQCTFTMEITKANKRIPFQHTIFRYRSLPETIHLTYLSPYTGRKVVYTADGIMQVRPEGFWKFTTFSFDPQGARAMANAIDPITAQGFPNIVSALEKKLKSAWETHSYSISVESALDSAKCIKMLRITLYQSDTEYMIIEVNAETLYPYIIQKKTGSDAAVYRYENIIINQGIPEEEFEP